jgi:hypothetical protein
VPLNYTDLHLRNGCKALTYYEGPLPGAVNNSSTAASTPSSALGNNDLEAGWIFSGTELFHLLSEEALIWFLLLFAGGIISHLLDPEEDATLLNDIYWMKLFN